MSWQPWQDYESILPVQAIRDMRRQSPWTLDYTYGGDGI